MSKLSHLLVAAVASTMLVGAAPTPTVTETDPDERIVMVDNLGGQLVIDPDDVASPDVVLPTAGSGDPLDAVGAEILYELPAELALAKPAYPREIDEALASASDNSRGRGGDVSIKVVVGADERITVNSRQGAYLRHAYLAFAKNDGNYRCSGALIGRSTIVTAGHCLYDGAKGGWVQGMNAFFGIQDNAAYLSCPATSITVSSNWVNSHQPEHDWGVINLGCPVGDYIGTMGYTDPGGALPPSGNWNVSGYPGDRPNYQLTVAAGQLQLADIGTRFRYTMDTAGGQSGGPIWSMNPGNGCIECVVGVHTTGYSILGAGTHNEGSRLTGSFKTAVDQFLAAG